MANQPQIAATYQSNIVSAFDVHKPDKMSKFFNRYGDQGASWYVTLMKLGFVKPVAATEYSHYENELKNPTFNARNTVVAPGTGNDLVITLATSNLDSNNNFYPRLQEIVNFKGGKQGMITDIDVSTPSAPVITISPIQAGALYALPGVQAGEEMSLVSNAYAEGTGQPKGVVPGAVERTNYTQIMKETLVVTGTELTNQTWMDGWVKLDGKIMADGQVASGDTWYNINFGDMEWRMNKQISGALLVGQSGDGTLKDADLNPIQTTQGIVPTVRALGNTQSYTPGSLSVTDFDAYSRILDREYAGDYVLCCNSKSFQDEMENTLVAYLANTNIVFEEIGNRFGGDGKSIAVDFSILKKSGRTFMYRREMAFSDRQTLGIEGSIYDGAALFLPCQKIKDAKTGEFVDNIGARYKEKNGYSRKMEIWSVNGAGNGPKYTQYDLNNTYMRADIGAHILGANQMIWIQTA